MVGDDELVRRLGKTIHTINSISKAPDGKPQKQSSVRKPGLTLAFRIEFESARDAVAARAKGFILPILASEIAKDWG